MELTSLLTKLPPEAVQLGVRSCVVRHDDRHAALAQGRENCYGRHNRAGEGVVPQAVPQLGCRRPQNDDWRHYQRQREAPYHFIVCRD